MEHRARDVSATSSQHTREYWGDDVVRPILTLAHRAAGLGNDVRIDNVYAIAVPVFFKMSLTSIAPLQEYGQVVSFSGLQ